MSTFYAITPQEMQQDGRSIIRSGTLREMLSYCEHSPELYRLWRITRRGNWHELSVADELSKARGTWSRETLDVYGRRSGFTNSH
jgi:hypothetical protein